MMTPTWKPVGPLSAEIIADLRFRRMIDQLWSNGPRATAEVFAEIGAERSIQTIIEQTIARHVALSADALQLVGGDRWPSEPFHEVLPR